MNKIDNKFLVIAFIVIVVLFLYFGIGVMNGDMSGMNHNNSWMSGNNWGWFPSIVTLIIGVLIGWLLFRKKNYSNKK